MPRGSRGGRAGGAGVGSENVQRKLDPAMVATVLTLRTRGFSSTTFELPDSSGYRAVVNAEMRCD